VSWAREAVALLDRFPGQRLAVIGDLVLDRYVVGFPARISREAPVLVLEERSAFARPGSAANPATNLSALGCAVEIIGVVGCDSEADTLLRALAETGVDTRGVVRAPGFTTAAKTRILAEDAAGRRQQMLRLDRVPSGPLDAATLAGLGAAIDHAAEHCAVLLVSDYKGGVVCEATIAAALAAARRHERPLVVDTQGSPFRFRGFTLVKSNQPDVEVALGARLETEDAFRSACAQLVERLQARAAVITRGAEGISALEASGEYLHLPAANRAEVVDVTGAGDTVIALLAAGLAVGAPLRETVALANLGASLVVRRLGVVAPTPDELRQAAREAD